jgi:hypothetical protein
MHLAYNYSYNKITIKDTSRIFSLVFFVSDQELRQQVVATTIMLLGY